MRKLLLAGLAGLVLASLPLATASAQYRYRWHGPGYYGGHYYGDYDAALAAGLFSGLIIGGALAGPAVAPPPAAPVYLYPPNTRLGYCERNLPGFDADTGTYIAPNGRRARCP